MKRIVLALTFFFIAFSVNAKVFNTGETLKKGVISAGIEPVFFLGGSPQFSMFIHGGYGLTDGIDLAIKAGFLGSTYFGADVEFALPKKMSVSAGAHSWGGTFGLDATYLATFGLSKGVNIYAGIDADLLFGNSLYLPLYIPIGLEIGLKDKMSFYFETEIGITESATHMIGGGVNLYF